MQLLQKQQNILPHGDVGRIINSFASGKHQDAESWQRNYRQTMYDNRFKNGYDHKALEQIILPVFLIATKNFNRKYIHARRFPDWRRTIKTSYNKLSVREKFMVNIGGLPKSWYPQTSMSRFIRIYRNTQVYTNTYTVVDPDPLPW